MLSKPNINPQMELLIKKISNSKKYVPMGLSKRHCFLHYCNRTFLIGRATIDCTSDRSIYLKTSPYSETDTYSKICLKSTMERFVKILEGYYFRNISFSQSLLYEINFMNFFNTSLIFTPEVFLLCKKV